MKGGTLKNIALATLALAGIVPGFETVKSQQGQVQQARQKEAINQINKTARQYVREYAGGLNVISYNYGIPLHIYGQYYVRRGTHKRTNK